MSTLLDTRTELDPITGEPKVAHIVLPGPGDENATTTVLNARIYGLQVETLCGEKLIPQRDPKQFPLCSKCKEIREKARPDEDPSEIPS